MNAVQNSPLGGMFFLLILQARVRVINELRPYRASFESIKIWRHAVHAAR
jgi:hypothetical protein